MSRPFNMLKRKKIKTAKKEEELEKTITVLQEILDSNKNVNQERKKHPENWKKRKLNSKK